MNKTTYAFLSTVVVLTLVVIGLTVLRDNREIGPIVPDTQVAQVGSSHAVCGDLCWLLIGWLFERGTAYVGDVAKNNSCNGPCGGGGGGGFGQQGCGEWDGSSDCSPSTR
jgi:hypothetical protein